MKDHTDKTVYGSQQTCIPQRSKARGIGSLIQIGNSRRTAGLPSGKKSFHIAEIPDGNLWGRNKQVNKNGIAY